MGVTVEGRRDLLLMKDKLADIQQTTQEEGRLVVK